MKCAWPAEQDSTNQIRAVSKYNMYGDNMNINEDDNVDNDDMDGIKMNDNNMVDNDDMDYVDDSKYCNFIDQLWDAVTYWVHFLKLWECYGPFCRPETTIPTYHAHLTHPYAMPTWHPHMPRPPDTPTYHTH